MNECEYCGRPGELKVAKGEGGIDKDVFVCNGCWRLLKDPRTALPLLRGHLTLNQRNAADPKQSAALLNKFMEVISTWKPRN